MKDTMDYTISTEKSFEEAVAAVQKHSEEKGFRILAIHDVQSTLESKGFQCRPLKIIEVCNARYASQVLAKDMKISLMLPCPISVYSEEGKTFISALRPKLIAGFYPHAGLEEIAAEVDAIILSIVDASR